MFSKKRYTILALSIVAVGGLMLIALSAKLYSPGGLPYSFTAWRPKPSPVNTTSSIPFQVNETQPVTAVTPLEYYATIDEDETCSRFSPTYLQDFLDHQASYCSSESPAKLTCFHRYSGFEGKTDSFCYAQGAVVDVKQEKFQLNCALRKFSEEEENDGLLPFDRLPFYWYGTGPANIFASAIDVGRSLFSRTDDEVEDVFEQMKGESQDSPQVIEEHPVPSVAPPKTLLLLMREGEGNPWHSLMEIFSTFMTFDILRMPGGVSRDQAPLFNDPIDSEDTQVVILDERAHGPYFDLWTLYARRKPMWLPELLADQATVENLGPVNLIIPLAGSSNPFWKDDAEAGQCTNSQTLEVFSRRVLDFYGIQAPSLQTQNKPILVTFVWRREHRRLKNENVLFAELGRRNPHISVQMVDFAALPFSDQIRIARESDVLVGIHGAGLTHSIFLRQGASAVVEIQPEGLDHRGFRNVAGMRNLGYFRTHAKVISETAWNAGEWDPALKNVPMMKRKNDENERDTRRRSQRAMKARKRGQIERREEWHFGDIEIEENRFFEVVEAAIKYMYMKGPWSLDMN
ncbi:hypothetical protein GGS21DRAFT_514102 [Xylaria nigripes]|nr:hypothetical protein GGS21DRAFT_514102 [Xylaria nigripes]